MWKNKNPGRNTGLQQESIKPGTFLRSPPPMYSTRLVNPMIFWHLID